jgi:succinoglycan biosynthesis protein ExoO
MLPSKRILIAPAAMPLRPAAGEPLPDTIAFVGSDNEVNQAGIQWFIAEVWPIVKARRPDAALKVYGEIGRKLGAAPAGVVIAGRVDDLTAAYHSASLCIVPLLAGSGLKVKLVEALCHGRAVVSTPVGAQGLEDLAGQAFWLADSSAAFAEAAVALLADDAQRRALEAAAIAIARDRFSAEACYGPLRRYLDEAVSSAGASPPGLRRRA